MKNACLRLLSATAISMLCAVGVVWTCGPDPAPLPTTTTLDPFDAAAFNRGELGVVRPRFRRANLAMAYRVLGAQPPLRLRAEAPAVAATFPENRWRKLRDGVLGPSPVPAEGRKRRMVDYVTPLNCLDDAFLTAERTFALRERQFGSGSAAVRDWTRAQDAVFANCNEEPLLLPDPAPAGADALTRADRAYQTAAAYFYGMLYEEAARRFRAIGDDASSPWRPYGRYLAARSLIRTATMGAAPPAESRQALVAAEAELRAVIDDPIASPIHASARGLITFVRMRSKPREELRALASRIATGSSEMTWAELGDFSYLMDKTVGDTVDYPYDGIAEVSDVRTTHDLVDWTLALQGSGAVARDRAIARWQETQTEPWLVAALWHLQSAHPAADELLTAAAAVRPTSPAYSTVAFLRSRLLVVLARLDEARPLLASLPDAPAPGISRETVNLFRAQRLMIARDLDEFLRAAVREAGPLYRQPNTAEFIASFDEDAAAVLDDRLPVDRLVDAAVSPALPRRLRARVATAAFTRAILLGRHDAARRVAPALAAAAPQLAADLDRYLRESTNEARARAAVLLILRTPGMTKDIRGLDDNYSVDHDEPRRTFESFAAVWWCGAYPSVQQPAPGDAQSELIHYLYPSHNVPYPSFITAAERAAVDRERAALEAIGHATTYLAEAALEWARARPTDTEAAEALARIVAGWRRACRDVEKSELSRRSFQALHRQFPNSEWAKRTRYWYR